MKTIPGGVTAPLGFRAAGIHCGIKKKKQLDLALLVSGKRRTDRRCLHDESYRGSPCASLIAYI